MLKYILSTIIIYLLVLFQTSFLVHFSFWGIIPNLVFILVIVWNIYEKSDNNFGIYNAFTAGFFLDIFSDRIIGFNVLILVILVILIKLIFNKYVQIPFKKI